VAQAVNGLPGNGRLRTEFRQAAQPAPMRRLAPVLTVVSGWRAPVWSIWPLCQMRLWMRRTSERMSEQSPSALVSGPGRHDVSHAEAADRSGVASTARGMPRPSRLLTSAGPQEAASRRKITMKNLWSFYAFGFLALTGVEVWRPALLLAAVVAFTAMLRSVRRRQAAAS
jgi:hypothetical protein